MKKRSLWILFITALLCLSMLFAACDSEGDIEETGTDAQDQVSEEATTEAVELETEERPVDVEVNYGNAIDAWEEYLSFVVKSDDDEKNGYTSMDAIFNTVSDAENVRFNTPQRYNNVYVVEKLTDTDGRAIKTVDVYNMETGSKILSKTERYDWEIGFTSYTFTIATDGNCVTLSEVITDLVDGEIVTRTIDSCYDLYGNLLVAVDPGKGGGESFSYSKNGAIAELVVVRYVSTMIADEEALIPETTYTYYDAESNVIADKLEKRAQWGYFGNSYYLQYITIDAKNYYMYDGEIIFVDEKLQPHMLPAEFGNNFKKLGTANGYNYYRFGDTIQVVNPEDYTIVANYTVPYTTRYTVDLLADGKVYVKAYSDNEGIFDSEDINGNTQLHRDILFDAKTGEAKEIDLPFVINSIKTAASLEGTDMAIKDGYQFAVIRNVTDGLISEEVEFVILDSNLAKVATLPKIMKNQTSFDGMVGSCQFVFGVSNADGYSVKYLADGNANTVNFYAGYEGGSDMTAIENGFLADNPDGTGYIVYDDNMVKLADISYEQFMFVDFGVVYFKDTKTVEITDDGSDDDDIFVDNSKPETEEINVYKAGYITDEGKFVVNQMTEGTEPQRYYYSYSYLEFFYARVGESIDGMPQELRFFSAYGQPLSTLNNITGFTVETCNDAYVLIKAETDGGSIYYIIK